MEGTEKLWVYVDGVKVSPERIMLYLNVEELYAELEFPDGNNLKFIRGNFYKHMNMWCFSSKDLID